MIKSGSEASSAHDLLIPVRQPLNNEQFFNTTALAAVPVIVPLTTLYVSL